jgi:hypothetical protein
VFETDERVFSGDVHVRAKARFEAAFEHAGDAILASDTAEVIATIGPLAAAVGRVGMPLMTLPDTATSEDLEYCVSTVLTTATLGATAHLLMADGFANPGGDVSGRSGWHFLAR